MIQRLFRLDRRLAITGLVFLGSGLLLGAGLVSLLLALTRDNVDLPSEGSLEEILEERQPGPGDQGPQLNEPDAPAPTRITIPRIGVDAAVVTLGLDADNYPEVPDAGDVVAWYDFSAPPGRGSNAVFSGHVDWYYWGGPIEGVFYHIRELQIGDEVFIKLEDGSRLSYRVTGNVAIPYEDPGVVDVMDRTSKDVITLVTCGGTWQHDYSNPYGGNYSHRVILRAERALELASEPAAGGN